VHGIVFHPENGLEDVRQGFFQQNRMEIVEFDIIPGMTHDVLAGC
jgi:hypothetical protein